MASDSAAKDILAFAKSRTNNVPLYMPDIEEFGEDEPKALEETLAAGSDDPDDSDDSDEYNEYEIFLDYIYDELASLGTGWHHINDVFSKIKNPNVTRGVVRNALDDMKERDAIAYNGKNKFKVR